MPQSVVLLVEDEVIIRMDVADALRAADYRVVEAASGDEAVAVVISGVHPDVLFTDVRMPGSLDGFELAETLRKRQPDLPVVIASAHCSSHPSAAGFPALFLQKPYNGAAAIEAVRAVSQQ